MEQVQVLIDKLVEQKRNNSSAAHMLITVQLLQHELVKLQQQPVALGSPKVSVIMPVTAAITGMQAPVEAPQKRQEVKKEEAVPPAARPVYTEPVKKEENKIEPYLIRKPVIDQHESKLELKREEPKPQPVPELHHFDAMAETPTLLQQPPPQRKELHEMIGERKDSLNDRLKPDNTELAHKLKDAPVKDLRKAIGINDKFVFVSELFRGDEGMYERSVKTINAFHILPEAEYWMNRELKVKLGWNDNKESVQHFYQLVRRRFS